MQITSPVNYLKETLAIKTNIEANFLALGERLYHIYEEGIWRGQFESYEDFLEAMDMRPAMASKLRSVYTKWVLEAGVAPAKLAKAGADKLYGSLPLLESGEPEDVLQKVTSLRRSELREEMREEKHGEHECQLGEEVYRRCGVCGAMRRVYEENH